MEKVRLLNTNIQRWSELFWINLLFWVLKNSTVQCKVFYSPYCWVFTIYKLHVVVLYFFPNQHWTALHSGQFDKTILESASGQSLRSASGQPYNPTYDWMKEIPHFALKNFMNFSRKIFRRTVELAKILIIQN